jgi:O-Antigen ligase
MALGVRVPSVTWVVAAAAGLAITAVWPTAGFVLAILIAMIALAAWAPVYAFAAALVLFGFEGSIKMRLSLETTPSALGLGAALIDVGLVIALAGLLLRDRGQALRRTWERFGRAERLVVLALAAWLCLSVLQVPLGGSLGQGLQGLRLVQFYLLALVGGLLVASQVPSDRLVLVLLGVGTIVSAYAAFRGIVGPTGNERRFAAERALSSALGEHARDTGSFTSPVALVSYLVPVGIFALVVGYLRPPRRLFAGVVFLLAMVGIIASYVRTALVAMIAGVIALAGLLAWGSGVSRRRRAYALGLIVVILAGGYGATLAAGAVDPVAEKRAKSLSNPFADKSVKERLKTWRRSLNKLVHKPIGTGVGTVGRATIVRARDATYTDNSYLKILQEQGFLGGFLFLLGVVGAVVLCAQRLVRAGPLSHPLGIAALTGFAGFLVLCLMGEYIEQPGKTFSWALLGIAVWEAYEP